MICGAGLLRPRRIMMIPAPTAAAPAPMSALLFGSLVATAKLLLPQPTSGRVLLTLPPDDHRTANDRQDDSTHPYTLPRLPWSRSGLLRRHVAQRVPYRPGVADGRPQDAEQASQQTTQSGSHECGHLAKKKPRIQSVSCMAALPPAVQPAWSMTVCHCSQVSSTSSRERQTCERESKPFTSSTTSQPRWWVWREQMARSSRSPLRLRRSKPVPSATGCPSQNSR